MCDFLRSLTTIVERTYILLNAIKICHTGLPYLKRLSVLYYHMSVSSSVLGT